MAAGEYKRQGSGPCESRAVPRVIARKEPNAIVLASKLAGPRVTHRLLSAARAGENRFWADIADLLPSRPGVLTVDVFDTVLTRRISTDDALAKSAGAIARRHRWWTDSLDAYLQLRTERAAMGPAEPIANWFSDTRHPNELVDNEANLEADVLCVIPGAVVAINHIRSLGWQIVFLSDMHHGSGVLTEWLDSFDVLADGDEVISSSDLGISKSQGDLFDHVTSIYGEVTHVGNQLWADVAMAANRGVAPIALRSGESNRYERVLETTTNGFGPVVAAAARRSRLDAGASRSVESEMQRLGSSVVGPMMVGFFTWAREHCGDRDLSSVVYLARDGRLPYEVAHELPSDYRAGLALSYLEGSRRTWQLPAASAMGVQKWIQLGTKDGASFLNHSREAIPFESLLGRVGLNTDDTLPTQLQHRLAFAPLDDESLRVWDEFINSEPAMRLIERRSDEARETLYRYLKATGLPTDNTAFVDIGWRGQMAFQMNAVLEGYLDSEPTHLHFGAHQTIPEIERQIQIERFAIHDNGDQPVDRPVSCLESIAASGGPKLIDLIWSPAGADPVFAPAQSEIFGQAKQALWSGARAMATKMPQLSELDAWGIAPASLESEVRELLRLFWMNPTACEAEAFSTMQFETDDDGRSLQPVAQSYSLAEIVTMRTNTKRQWRSGSIELASAPLRIALKSVNARLNAKSA